jgi:hypothetical protein
MVYKAPVDAGVFFITNCLTNVLESLLSEEIAMNDPASEKRR